MIRFTAGYSPIGLSFQDPLCRHSPPQRPRLAGCAPVWRDPFVLVVAGQSNAANHGSRRARAGSKSAFSVNGLFHLEDPLLGAKGR